MRAIFSSSGKRLVAVGAAGAILALALASGSAVAERGASQSAATATVNIRDLAFHPGKLTVTRGTKVVFANRDSVTHTAKRKGSFATGRIAPGKSVSVRFKSSGVYAYHCTIHTFMHGKIVVD
jgi:plastocyanin